MTEVTQAERDELIGRIMLHDDDPCALADALLAAGYRKQSESEVIQERLSLSRRRLAGMDEYAALLEKKLAAAEAEAGE